MQSQCNILPCFIQQLLPDKGGQGTIGPLRRFFGDFSASVPKIRADGDGFLADRAHTCERSESGFAGERKLPVGDWARSQCGRELSKTVSPSVTADAVSAPSSEGAGNWDRRGGFASLGKVCRGHYRWAEAAGPYERNR